MNSTVYLHSISHQLGEIRPIEEIQELAINLALCKTMRGLGCNTFSRVEGGVRQLLLDSARRTLQLSGLATGEIDVILYASSTYDPLEDVDDIGFVADELKLYNAFPVGVFLGFCAGFSQGMCIAEGLFAAGRAKNILFITGDKIKEDRESRLLMQNSAVISDGVASCILTSAKVENGYCVQSSVHSYLPSTYKLRGAEKVMDYVLQYSRGVSTAFQTANSQASLVPDDYSRLITGNFNKAVLQNLSQLTGIEMERFHTKNIGHFGHCFSADLLIGLEDLQTEEALEHRERLMLIGAGGYIWGASVVLRHWPSPAGRRSR